MREIGVPFENIKSGKDSVKYSRGKTFQKAVPEFSQVREVTIGKTPTALILMLSKGLGR
jgi:hypothetical protein